MSDFNDPIKDIAVRYLRSSDAGNAPDVSYEFVKLLQKLDPAWAQNLIEEINPLWYQLLENPEQLAKQDPRGFLSISRWYLHSLKREALVVWLELDAENFLEYLDVSTPFFNEDAVAIWAQRYPRNFIEHCRNGAGRALNGCYDAWKELDPKGCEQALLAQSDDDAWSETLILKTQRDHPEKIKELLAKETELYRKIYEENAGNYTDYTELNRRGELPQELYDLWAEISPESFCEMLAILPGVSLEAHCSNWVKAGKESYLKACAEYPANALVRGEILFQADPELLKTILESGDDIGKQRSLHVKGTVQHARLLLDWDKYKDQASVSERIVFAPEQQLRENPEETLGYVGSASNWLMGYGELKGVLDACLKVNPELYPNVLHRIIETNLVSAVDIDVLETWWKLDGADWARCGMWYMQTILKELETSLKIGRNSTDQVEKVTKVISHYKEHSKTLVTWMKEDKETSGGMYLDMGNLLFTDEQKQDLTQTFLEEPGMNQDKIMWATLRAGTLSNTGREVKVRSSKPKTTKGTGRENR